MSRVTFTALRAFSEVAACLSFTQAAAQVFRSQPALSRQISQLESELGLKLFDRDGAKLRLTAEGRDLYQRAQRLLSEVNEFSERAQALAAGSVGNLRVGGTSMSFDRTMPKLLKAYKVQWPHVDVAMFEDHSASLMLRVESRDLDIAVTRYVASDVLEAKRLFPMHLLAVVGKKSHWLASATQAEVIDLVNEPLLLMPPDTGSRVLLEQACRQCGSRLRNVRFEGRSYGALIEMAHAGHGIAIVLSTVFAQHPELHAVPVFHRGRELGHWAAVLWRRGSALPPHVEAFVRLSVEICRTTKSRRP